MAAKNNNSDEKPLFRIKSRFHPAVVSYSFPVRISGIFLVLLFVFPEMARLFAFITGIGGFISYVFAGVLVSLAALCGPLFMTWLDYKAIVYSFYEDRIEFIQGFWVREKLKIPYHGITKVEPKINWLQKKYKVGNIKLVAEPKLSGITTQEHGHELPDIYNSKKVAKNLSILVAAHHKKRREQAARN